MGTADTRDALIVAVLRDGKIFLRTDPVRAKDLPMRIREGVRQGAENRVYLKTDARAKYGAVKEVIDGIHDAGVVNVGIIVDEQRPSSIPH